MKFAKVMFLHVCVCPQGGLVPGVPALGGAALGECLLQGGCLVPGGGACLGGVGAPLPMMATGY